MLDRDKKDKLAEVAKKMVMAGLKHKRQRFTDIMGYVESYNNKVRPALRGRFNVPVPILGGFVDTLQSKIDERTRIQFTKHETADYRKALKVQAAWDFDSFDTQGDWHGREMSAKKFAIFTGRAIHQYFASSEPEYKSNLLTISPWDFVCEPKGGGILENHSFRGKINVFRDKYYLWDMVQRGVYDVNNVREIITTRSSGEEKETQEEIRQKEQLMEILNLRPDQGLYLADDEFNLTELEFKAEGKRWYILFDFKSGKWLRLEELKNVYGHNEWSYISWATHHDDDNFWSKSPCDDMKPTAEGIQLGINQLFDAMNKRNWPQRVVDYKRLVDPSQLDWRPYGIIEVNRQQGESLDNYVRTFQDASDSSLPTVQINILNFLKEFVSRETGITPSAQGLGDEKQATILVSNLRQVSDRLGLYNNYYTKARSKLGELYALGLKENISEKHLVKIIGEAGVEEEYLTKEDTSVKFDISVSGSNAEEQQNELKIARKEKALDRVATDPELRQSVNKKWRLKEVLAVGGYDEVAIAIATDVESEGSEDIVAAAAQAIQNIIRNKPVKRYINADKVFLSYIYRFTSTRDLKPDVYRRIIEYADAHILIAIENQMAKAEKDAAVVVRKEMMQPMSEEMQLRSMQPGSMSQKPTELSPQAAGLLRTNLLPAV